MTKMEKIKRFECSVLNCYNQGKTILNEINNRDFRRAISNIKSRESILRYLKWLEKDLLDCNLFDKLNTETNDILIQIKAQNQRINKRLHANRRTILNEVAKINHSNRGIKRLRLTSLEKSKKVNFY